MKQKVIKTDKTTLLVVEMPEGKIHGFKVTERGNLTFFKYDELKGSFPIVQQLPKGNWQRLGRLPDITEGQFEKIVDFGDQEPGNDKYILKWKDYEVANVGEECPYMDYSLDTATESFYSLLRSNDIYFDNPIPPFKERYEDFKEAQSKVWDKERTYLFIKVD